MNVGKTARTVGVPTETLKFWEEQFPEFLSPGRDLQNRRTYSPADIQTLFIIKRLLHEEMFSIVGVRKALNEQNTNS